MQKKGAYVIPPVIALYDNTIDKDATRFEINCAEGKHEARRNDRQLYKTADNVCRSFIMEVVDETWYEELEDPDTFYIKVTDLKLLDHLIEFCAGLHTVDAVDIPHIMKSLYKDSEVVDSIRAIWQSLLNWAVFYDSGSLYRDFIGPRV